MRYAPRAQAPGANVYSNDPRDVWVDEAGRLHLRVAHRNGQWLCTELSTPGVGYGTYVFYVSGQVDRMDPNVVLGLFTWDPKLFETGAWDEIDIEMTRWGKGFWNLQYSVQPLYGPDSPNGRYDERSKQWYFALEEPRSTHVIVWTPDSVRFQTYQGFSRDLLNLRGDWEFTSDHPARRANDTNLATPVGIPPATPSMEMHLDLWLNDTDKDGFGDPPMNGMETEVVIDAVEFIPAGI